MFWYLEGASECAELLSLTWVVALLSPAGRYHDSSDLLFAAKLSKLKNKKNKCLVFSFNVTEYSCHVNACPFQMVTLAEIQNLALSLFISLLWFFFPVRSQPAYLNAIFFPSFVLKSGSQSFVWVWPLDYSRILTPKFLLGWQTSTKTPRDTKERWAVNWSLIVLAHYGVPQWGRSYFVAPQGQYLKARVMEGICCEIFNLRECNGTLLVKYSRWILIDCSYW